MSADEESCAAPKLFPALVGLDSPAIAFSSLSSTYPQQPLAVRPDQKDLLATRAFKRRGRHSNVYFSGRNTLAPVMAEATLLSQIRIIASLGGVSAHEVAIIRDNASIRHLSSKYTSTSTPSTLLTLHADPSSV